MLILPPGRHVYTGPSKRSELDTEAPYASGFVDFRQAQFLAGWAGEGALNIAGNTYLSTMGAEFDGSDGQIVTTNVDSLMNTVPWTRIIVFTTPDKAASKTLKSMLWAIPYNDTTGGGLGFSTSGFTFNIRTRVINNSGLFNAVVDGEPFVAVVRLYGDNSLGELGGGPVGGALAPWASYSSFDNSSTARTIKFGSLQQTTNRPFNGTIHAFYQTKKVLSDEILGELLKDPWAWFYKPPANDAIFHIIGDSVGGGTVTGTGALAPSDSSIAGTGTITRIGTSALASDASAISGTGVIERVGTGDVQSQSSAISATGVIGRVSTGALSADSSAIAGTGTVTEAGTVTGTGALTSQASALSASGIIGRIGTGSIVVDVSQISATGVIGRTGTGALAAQSSAISGTGSIPGEVTGTASLVCEESSIYGVGTKSGWAEVPSAGGSWSTVAEVTTIWTEI